MKLMKEASSNSHLSMCIDLRDTSRNMKSFRDGNIKRKKCDKLFAENEAKKNKVEIKIKRKKYNRKEEKKKCHRLFLFFIERKSKQSHDE